VWPQPNDEQVLKLARALAPFVRFLNPEIVGAVAEDNRRLGAEWRTRLEGLDINPAIYLWEGSPCSFPGVRRYAGQIERVVFQQRANSDEVLPQCLDLDDNDYPRHLWAFVFTGTGFRKKGPIGYELAHLFDHKEHGNRWRHELDLPPDAEEPAPLFGLFTSAANSVYTPAAFVRPTDHSPKLRNLLQRRALQLYGRICRIVPPPLAVKPCEDTKWALDNFQWSEPVGDMGRLPDFLVFRRQQMVRLLERRSAVLRPRRHA